LISVVICTRNRSLKLERCLRHLGEIQADSDLVLQLIVVDNDSQDDTKAVVDKLAGSLPLKYVFESGRGLSHARNRGIADAQYPIIAFTDDDCLVGSDWARTIVTEFEKDPELAILGGRVELADSGDYPVAIRIHDKPAEIATIGQIMRMMSGCNMAVRRRVFDEIGLFDPAFGKGTRIGSAEDTDFLYRALKHGSRIAYLPDVVVRHAHGRNTAAALESLTNDYVKGRGAFYCKFIGDRQIAKMAYWEVRKLLADRSRPRAGSRPQRLLRSLTVGALYKLADGVVNGAARAVNRLANQG
jgi:GT2 family glycosyltransferase